MEKLLYSIGEVAEMLGTTVSRIRYWSDEFSDFVVPKRSGNGKRMYTADQVDMLRCIKFLSEDRGLHLESVKMELRREDKRSEKLVKALESLKSIRERLMEIRKTI